jgi:hypothetical protein
VGAITPGALELDFDPMDSPLWVLDGVGDPLVISGNSILVELQAYNKTTLVTDTFRFGTDGYSHPTGPGYYDPRMTQSINFRRDMFSGNTTGGGGRSSFGEMRLANNDGGLDTLRANYAFAGWPAKILIGDPSQAYSTFETLITGKPQQVFFTESDVSVTLRDRMQDLSKPVQTNKYLGNNVLPNGLEGNIDMKDKLKPVLYGRVQNITPILVNTAKLIYQVNDGAVGYLPYVYDKGVALTQGPAYTSQAEMLATQPTPGQFRVLHAEGYFRLGATPSGTITCDAADTYTLDGAERDIGNTAAQAAIRAVVRPSGSEEGGLLSTDIEMGDVAVLDLVAQGIVGVWAADTMSYQAALDTLLGSVGAWYGFDRFDKFRMQRLDAPTGTGVCTFRPFRLGSDAGVGDFDILSFRFLPTNDPDRGIPTWEIELDWGLNYTVQSKDNLAGSVNLDRQNFLGDQYRTAKAQNTALKTPYPLAMSKKVNTVLIDGTAAQNEANRLLAIYSVQRDFVEIDTPLNSEIIATVDIGRQVYLTAPRFNYTPGRPMVVIGMQYNPGTRGLTLALWG